MFTRACAAAMFYLNIKFYISSNFCSSSKFFLLDLNGFSSEIIHEMLRYRSFKFQCLTIFG